MSVRFTRVAVLLLMFAFVAGSNSATAQTIATPARDARWVLLSVPGNIPATANVAMAILPLYDTGGDNDLTREQVQALNARSIAVYCTINAGYWDAQLPDADLFNPSMKGADVWSDSARRWADIRNTGVRQLMEARVAHAADIGCAGIDANYLELWYQNTGFYISYGDQLNYSRWFADTAHKYGLSIGLHNAPFQLADLVSWYDFGIAENCLDSGDCEAYTPFISAGKPVFDLEYNAMSSEVDICTAGRELGFNTIIKGFGDDTTFVDCRDRG